MPTSPKHKRYKDKGPHIVGAKPGKTKSKARPSFKGRTEQQKADAKFSPRNLNQAQLHTALHDEDIQIAFAVGPAGGGKTYVPLKVAFDLVADPNSKINKVYVFRPHTTASGQKMGALPGDLDDKTSAYTKAIDGNVEKITGKSSKHWVSNGTLEMSTADTSRGDTFDNAFIIIDEAQNFSKSEIMMLATRIGENSKMVFTGDISNNQNDLNYKEGGLVSAAAHFANYAKIDEMLDKATAFIKFTADDAAARSGILPSILKAFDTIPEGFKQLADNAVSKRYDEYNEALAHNRELSLELLSEAATTTSERFTAATTKQWGHILRTLGETKTQPAANENVQEAGAFQGLPAPGRK